MQITEDIEMVEGARGANAYLISSEDGAILVDSGLPRRRLVADRSLGQKLASLPGVGGVGSWTEAHSGQR